MTGHSFFLPDRRIAWAKRPPYAVPFGLLCRSGADAKVTGVARTARWFQAQRADALGSDATADSADGES
jgi:hypothetical protein